MTNPYEVGKWLAKEVTGKDPHDHEMLLWAGRAAQPIADIAIVDDAQDGAVNIHFEEVGTLVIADRGRSCCESRYITCDDDLSSFAGARLLEIDLAAGGDCVDSEWGDPHEQQFVKVRTTNGDFTLCTHNEHNGYYGGFYLKLEWLDAA